jgi:hypothetical protein
MLIFKGEKKNISLQRLENGATYDWNMPRRTASAAIWTCSSSAVWTAAAASIRWASISTITTGRIITASRIRTVIRHGIFFFIMLLFVCAFCRCLRGPSSVRVFVFRVACLPTMTKHKIGWSACAQRDPLSSIGKLYGLNKHCKNAIEHTA